MSDTLPAIRTRAPHGSVPDPGLPVAGLDRRPLRRRQSLVHGRQRRDHHQRNHRTAYPGAGRSDTAGDTRHGPLFHRRHRPERQPLPHAEQRFAGHGQADAALCARFFKKITLTQHDTRRDFTGRKDIVATLKNIYDPEIPVNIYDLGLIYEIDYEPDGVANIRMTLTRPQLSDGGHAGRRRQSTGRQSQGREERQMVTSRSHPVMGQERWMSEEALLELNML